MLKNIRVVLVEPSHPGNIGSAARAMKTMGLHRLYLVNPKEFPHLEATALASGASDVLEGAICCSSLMDALHGTVFSVASTSRHRELSHVVLNAKESAERLLSDSFVGDVALVFGPERTGLSVEDASLCNAIAMIACNPQYSSLNLAQAVQVFCYELALVSEEFLSTTFKGKRASPASHEEVEMLMTHLEDVLIEVDFLKPKNPGRLMQRLRRLILRSDLEKEEVNILRGFLGAVQKKGR